MMKRKKLYAFQTKFLNQIKLLNESSCMATKGGPMNGCKPAIKIIDVMECLKI